MPALTRRGKFPARRLSTDGILIALFFALSFLNVEIGGVKLTFDSLPVVLCAMLFGPVDAFFVGFLGAFLEQMLHYGFTATTLLWVLPPACRGLAVGLAVRFLRRPMSMQTIWTQRRPYVYLFVCALAAMLTSCLNTVVYYIDARLYGYYSYALIFGVLGVRLLTGVLTALITALLIPPIVAGLQKARLAGQTSTS